MERVWGSHAVPRDFGRMDKGLEDGGKIKPYCPNISLFEVSYGGCCLLFFVFSPS